MVFFDSVEFFTVSVQHVVGYYFTCGRWRGLYFAVREPFPSKASRASLVFGAVTKKQPLTLISHMPENGVIFSDGIEADFLDFNAGTVAAIEIAGRSGRLVV